jgi:hypothetical protein
VLKHEDMAAIQSLVCVTAVDHAAGVHRTPGDRGVGGTPADREDDSAPIASKPERARTMFSSHSAPVASCTLVLLSPQCALRVVWVKAIGRTRSLLLTPVRGRDN